MCLKIKKIRHLDHGGIYHCVPKYKAKIAKKPIKCYKVLYYSNRNKLHTPVVWCKLDISNKELVADNMKKKTCNIVIENGIHTFSKLKTAYQYCDLIATRVFVVGIFPAIIPKGTYYWIGKNHQYVSERIEFL